MTPERRKAIQERRRRKKREKQVLAVRKNHPPLPQPAHRSPIPPTIDSPRPQFVPRGERGPTPAGVVPRDYEGCVAVCFASGPGLTQDIVDLIRPFHFHRKIVTFGLNDTYKIVDYLDEFYACDQHWWKYHVENPYFEGGKSVLDIPSRIWGNQTAKPYLKKHAPHVNIIHGQGASGFSTNQALIHWGSNSGYQLLNLCYLFGVARILLVGYNMGVPPGKEQHFFGPHPKPMSQSNSYRGFVKQYRKIQPEIKKMIINCTEESFLDCFQKATLASELARL